MEELDVGQFAQVVREAHTKGLCDIDEETLGPVAEKFLSIAMSHLAIAVQMLELADLHQTEFLSKNYEQIFYSAMNKAKDRR